MDFFKYDFNYAWPWTYGHLIAAIVFAGLAALAYWLNWTRLTILAGVLSIWGLCGAYIIHGPLRFSRPVALPTERFLPTGSGRVLDAGAGSGRSTLMVLLSRPAAKVVALDRFTGYYGIVDHTRRHNEPENRDNRRRVDPVLVIKEVQEAGFELVDFSNLYYRPNDALALEVANPEVNDRTDRIALLFRKPQ